MPDVKFTSSGAEQVVANQKKISKSVVDGAKQSIQVVGKMSAAEKKLAQDRVKDAKAQERQYKSWQQTVHRAVESTKSDFQKFSDKIKQVEVAQKKLGKTEKEISSLRSKQIKKYNSELGTTRRKIKDTGSGLKEVGRSGKGAFGSGAVSTLAKYTVGLFSVQKAASLVLGTLQDIREERSQAGNTIIEASQAMGGLAQLAGGDAKKMRLLTNASKATFAEGAFKTLDESAQLTFQLESAGALGSRGFFSQFQGIDDSAKIVKAAGLIRSTLGAKEAGGFIDITSKGMAAAAPATDVSPSDVLSGASRAGVSASALGVGFDELLAATSITSQATGNGDEAGTRVNALLRALTRQGFAESHKGQSLGEMLKSVDSQGMDQQELIKFFGRAEAAQAFGLLKDTGLLKQRQNSIVSAGKNNAAQKAIATAMGNKSISQARFSRGAENTEVLGLEREGMISKRLDQKLQQLRDSDRKIGVNELAIKASEKWASALRMTLGDEDAAKKLNIRLGTFDDEFSFENFDKQKLESRKSTQAEAARKQKELAEIRKSQIESDPEIAPGVVNRAVSGKEEAKALRKQIQETRFTDRQQKASDAIAEANAKITELSKGLTVDVTNADKRAIKGRIGELNEKLRGGVLPDQREKIQEEISELKANLKGKAGSSTETEIRDDIADHEKRIKDSEATQELIELQRQQVQATERTNQLLEDSDGFIGGPN